MGLIINRPEKEPSWEDYNLPQKSAVVILVALSTVAAVLIGATIITLLIRAVVYASIWAWSLFL